jgi:hypothetical protein
MNNKDAASGIYLMKMKISYKNITKKLVLML